MHADQTTQRWVLDAMQKLCSIIVLRRWNMRQGLGSSPWQASFPIAAILGRLPRYLLSRYSLYVRHYCFAAPFSDAAAPAVGLESEAAVVGESVPAVSTFLDGPGPAVDASVSARREARRPSPGRPSHLASRQPAGRTHPSCGVGVGGCSCGGVGSCGGCCRAQGLSGEHGKQGLMLPICITDSRLRK